MAEKQNKQISDETKEVTLEVNFSTSKLIIKFIKNSIYDGRKLIIKGEALSWGFDAYPDSMIWVKPFENETIDEITRKNIMDVILEENSRNGKGFNIVLNGGKDNV